MHHFIFTAPCNVKWDGAGQAGTRRINSGFLPLAGLEKDFYITLVNCLAESMGELVPCTAASYGIPQSKRVPAVVTEALLVSRAEREALLIGQRELEDVELEAIAFAKSGSLKSCKQP